MKIARLASFGPGLRIALILTAFLGCWLYLLPAAAAARAVAAGIAAGTFYGRTDFAAATWAAGAALRHGQIATLYHARWLYPPPTGLLAVPFSLLPLPMAYWLWMGGTNLLAAVLLRRAGLRWWVVVAGLAAPAAFYNLLLGQNGALTAGLLVAALLDLKRRPALAGVLAGCLCAKPQLGALLPAVLLANGRWRPVCACMATVAVLAGAATWAFGWRSWWLFITVAQPEAHRQLVAPFGAQYQLADYSVFMMARSLGLTVTASWVAQGLGAAGAVLGVWTLWRTPANHPTNDAVRRAFLTVCFTMLAVPFGFLYDLLGYSVLVVAMLPQVPAARWPVLAALWLWPGLTILIAMDTHIVLVPLAALSGILLAWTPPLTRLPSSLTAKARLANPARIFD